MCKNITRKTRKQTSIPKMQISQVTKGIRWMPRCQEPMKDAISCEKLWGVANRH